MSTSPSPSATTAHPYLWVAGAAIAHLPAGATVGQRYRIIAPNIWQDLHPEIVPDSSADLPDLALPYLHLYYERLHVPEVYGVFHLTEGLPPALLLSNAPISAAGELLPAIGDRWDEAAPVRQVYWLWQILQLWASLQQWGVTSSLLVHDNIRIEGWCVRLRELYPDPIDQVFQEGDSENEQPAFTPVTPTLQELALCWQPWIERSPSEIRTPLQALCNRMARPSTTWTEVSGQLNQLLLEQAARLPLSLEVASASTSGPQRQHNEDYCYPEATPVQFGDLDLRPYLAIVCDGIGGHAAGEIASQLAVRSLKVQMRAIFTELQEQTEPLAPEVVAEQLAAMIRVVNNMIANHNDSQGREARQRMGTTLVMALQLPQRIPTPTGAANSHELYLAHLGDSRAYWLTAEHCRLLTLDDDVISREVLMGRSLYCDAQQRPDAEALTQALGTRDGDLIQPHIQRFILEEDGILLLCSDGLSDHHGVERSWQDVIPRVLSGEITLDAAAQGWIDLANQRNGHDNASVVLLRCQLSGGQTLPPASLTERPLQTASEGLGPVSEEGDRSLMALLDTPPDELSEASQALLYDEPSTEPVEHIEQFFDEYADEPKAERANLGALALGTAVLMLAIGAAGVFAWKQLSPASFQRTWDAIIERLDSP